MSELVHRARTFFPDRDSVAADPDAAARVISALADSLAYRTIDSARQAPLTSRGYPALTREHITALASCPGCRAEPFAACERRSVRVHPSRVQAAQAAWRALFGTAEPSTVDSVPTKELMEVLSGDLERSNEHASFQVYGELATDSAGVAYIPVTSYTDDGDIDGVYRMRVAFEKEQRP